MPDDSLPDDLQKALLGDEGLPRTVLFEAAPLGVVVSRKGICLRANPAFLRLFGHDDESEIRGRSMYDHIAEGDRDTVRAISEERERTGAGPREYESMGRRRDGSTFPLLIQATRVKLDGGMATLAFLSDISARREMEAQLRSREETFRSYVEQSRDIIFTLDAEGVFRFISPAWERHFGFPASEALGRPFIPFVHPEDVGPCMTYLQRVLTTGQGETSPPYRVQHADGSWRWFIANGTVLALSGTGREYIGVAHDITEDRRGQEALRQSEEQMRIIFEASDAGIILVSPGGRIQYANRRMADLFGMDAGALIGTDYAGHLHPSEKAEGDGLMRSLIQGGIHFVSVDRHYLRADGGDFWGHLSGRRLENPDGSLRALVGIVTDLTHRLQGEAQQRILVEQLHQAQKMESLGILAGGVAHDMNNVLGAILGLASAHLEAHPHGSPARRAFGTIIQAAERGGTLLKSLLSFARSGPSEVRDLDLNALLLEEAHLMERTTLAKVRLEVDLAPDLRPIRGDAGALAHAFMNLCVNAVDAMAENGVLTLRTRNREDGWVDVEVEDTGAGMPPEVLGRALDPFFTTKEVGKGTGLGLSIVYRTVKAHGGRLDLRSQPGRGTCVTLSFPGSLPGAESREPEGPEDRPATAALKVLLVDDDELIRGSLLGLLDLLGHAATPAASGEEALAAVAAGFRPDLIILDMNMPGLGGAGTLPRLRVLLPATPVLLATGRADQAAQDLAQAYPSVTLLPKPFGKKELQAHLEQAAGG